MDIEHIGLDCRCSGKVCSQCAHLLCIDKYHKETRSKDGLRGECKECRKLFRAQNHERILQQERNYRERNHEERIARDRIRYNKKRGTPEFKQQRQKYYLNGGKAYQQEYVIRTADKWKEYRQKRYQERKEEHQAWKKNYYKQNPDASRVDTAIRRARKAGASGKHTRRQWLNLKASYDFTCLCCGRREPDIQLCADHVIPLSKGGSNGIENIQPLCRSCNAHKHTSTTDYRLTYQGDKRAVNSDLRQLELELQYA